MRTLCGDGLKEGLVPLPQPVAIKTMVAKAASRFFNKWSPSDEGPILSYDYERENDKTLGALITHTPEEAPSPLSPGKSQRSAPLR